ncbi:hypothetical protein GGH99_007162, partial [Coemansia sp. RSA 1285]
LLDALLVVLLVELLDVLLIALLVTLLAVAVGSLLKIDESDRVVGVPVVCATSGAEDVDEWADVVVEVATPVDGADEVAATDDVERVVELPKSPNILLLLDVEIAELVLKAELEVVVAPVFVVVVVVVELLHPNMPVGFGATDVTAVDADALLVEDPIAADSVEDDEVEEVEAGVVVVVVVQVEVEVVVAVVGDDDDDDDGNDDGDDNTAAEDVVEADVLELERLGFTEDSVEELVREVRLEVFDPSELEVLLVLVLLLVLLLVFATEDAAVVEDVAEDPNKNGRLGEALDVDDFDDDVEVDDVVLTVLVLVVVLVPVVFEVDVDKRTFDDSAWLRLEVSLSRMPDKLSALSSPEALGSSETCMMALRILATSLPISS